MNALLFLLHAAVATLKRGGSDCKRVVTFKCLWQDCCLLLQNSKFLVFHHAELQQIQ